MVKWFDTTLQDKDRKWLHKEVTTDLDGGITDNESDGDQPMDQSGATKRSADEAGLTSNNDSKRTTGQMETALAANPPNARGALTSAAASSSPAGTGETPVSLNVPRELGLFTETRTAILPITFYASFTKLRNVVSGNVLKIRMNAPFNILRDTTFVQQTEGSAVAEGISTIQRLPYAATNEATFTPFNTTLVPGTAPTANTAGAGVVADAEARPAWRAWYQQLYKAYHTIETQYRITLNNPETTPGLRARVVVDKDVYTAASTGNQMPTGSTITRKDMLQNGWKNLEEHIVTERNNNDDRGWNKVIEGVWRPGMWQRETLNDTDIKAWYATGAQPDPTWVENLVLVAFNDDFNSVFSFGNLNVMVELRYVVQFKNLTDAIRYPVAGTNITPLVVNWPTDILQTPRTDGPWGGTT